jgi:hypothetical protein
VTNAEMKALGITPPGQTSDGYDGGVGFVTTPVANGKNFNWSFSPTATPASDSFYFIGAVEHEISEVMGRVSDLDVSTPEYSPMDLYRFAPGSSNRVSDESSQASFSIDLATSSSH